MSDKGMELHQQITKIKIELDTKKAERQELQGQLKSVMEQLQEYGISTLEEAQAKITREEKELSDMTYDIEEQIKTLKEMMEGNME